MSPVAEHASAVRNRWPAIGRRDPCCGAGPHSEALGGDGLDAAGELREALRRHRSSSPRSSGRPGDGQRSRSSPSTRCRPRHRCRIEAAMPPRPRAVVRSRRCRATVAMGRARAASRPCWLPRAGPVRARGPPGAGAAWTRRLRCGRSQAQSRPLPPPPVRLGAASRRRALRTAIPAPTPQPHEGPRRPTVAVIAASGG